jgi:hypothetical protein
VRRAAQRARADAQQWKRDLGAARISETFSISGEVALT